VTYQVTPITMTLNDLQSHFICLLLF